MAYILDVLGRPLQKNVRPLHGIYSRCIRATTVGICVAFAWHKFQMYQGDHCKKMCSLCKAYILDILGRLLQENMKPILGIISRCIRATTVGECVAYPWHKFQIYQVDQCRKMCSLCLAYILYVLGRPLQKDVQYSGQPILGINSRCIRATTVRECVAYLWHKLQMYQGDHCRRMCNLSLA